MMLVEVVNVVTIVNSVKMLKFKIQYYMIEYITGKPTYLCQDTFYNIEGE